MPVQDACIPIMAVSGTGGNNFRLRILATDMAKFGEKVDQVPYQEPNEDGEYTCPICQDYTGQRTSVEAHITGKSDDSHQGRVGKDYRSRDENGNLRLTEVAVLSSDDDRINNQATKSVDTEPEEVSTTPEASKDEDEPEDRDGGVSGILIGVAFALVIWLAQKTDNEDQIQMEF
jgi:hypothetical protein